MHCPSCNSENPDGKKFCGECGSPLVLRCASCGAESPPRFKFCGDCGAQLPTPSSSSPVPSSKFQVPSPQPSFPNTQHPTPSTQSAGERRQLTVMFCDLVGSTALSEQLDPEELREVVRTYQDTCTDVIRRYDGHIAQHLGDGLLVYFGYPEAHEDDAARSVRAGLEIITELPRLNEQASATIVGARRRRAPTDPMTTSHLQVRIGVHTGLVVIGEIGSGEKREILALGETPNIAARLQGLAEPNTVVISAATQHLVQGLFEHQDLGPQTLKGVSVPLAVSRIIGENATQSRFAVAVKIGLTPLVGREEELGVLRRRWEQAKAGEGQVVLLSGEPGIGKSRLVDALKEHARREGAMTIEFRCSPYHQNSALYPIIDHQTGIRSPWNNPRGVRMSEQERLLIKFCQEIHHPRVSGFEVLELLDVRSTLAGKERELTEVQRQELEEADSAFLKNAEQLYESVIQVANLEEMRKRATVPPSHWWWYLEKLRPVERAAL